MIDRGIIASYLLSPLSKKNNLENASQFELVKDSNSNRVKDLLLHNKIPVTLYGNLSTFCDTGKLFEMNGDVLKMITIKNYNVDLASLSDKKKLYDFAKEIYFDVKAPVNKSILDRTLLKLLKSPAIMAFRISTIFLSTDPHWLCDRLKLLLQQKQAGNNCKIFNGEIVALTQNILEYKCISIKQHRFLLLKCLN